MIRAAGLSLVFAGAAIAQQMGGRDCALCHMAWVESFKNPNAVLLMPKPPESHVAEQDNCLGCHDGAVGDSRRRVWLEHGHRTGVAPPSDMTVAKELPLQDGTISCRTCHSAHAGLGPETLATAVFIRVPNDRSQLCTMCHSVSGEGPENGEHPLGRMPHPVPQELLVAGSHYGAQQNEVTCQSCHTPHGAAASDLLALAPQSNRLCMSCHEELTPDLWRSTAEADQPHSPQIETPAQHAAIESWHGIAGDNDALVCLSCHKMHGPRKERRLLASSMQASGMCVSCHPGYDGLFGSRHDLRASAPQERNRQDLTADQSGPCGACHSFHHFARQRSARPADPAGVCGTCHSAGECAESAGGLSFPHPVIATGTTPTNADIQLYRAESGDTPQITCLTCHNPHDVKHTQFLRADRDSLCASCHAAQSDSLAGAHDFASRIDQRNGLGELVSQSGKCGFCHSLHDGVGPALWAATANAPTSADALCTTCHQAGGMADNVVSRPVLHPHGPDMKSASIANSSSPLYDENGRRSSQGFIACGTCHDPHANSANSPALLRGWGHGPAYSHCTDCHQDMAVIELSGHSPMVIDRRSRTDGSEVTDRLVGGNASQHAPGIASCGPCHAVHDHAEGASTQTQASLMPQGTTVRGWPANAGRCLGCHGSQGTATRVNTRSHPPFAMVRGSGAGQAPAAQYLPVFDLAGNPTTDAGAPTSRSVTASGAISCQTCHLPHGATDLASVAGVGPLTLTATQIAGPKTLLRPYNAPNLCSSCHGFEGLYRYLNFHDTGRQPTSRSVTVEP